MRISDWSSDVCSSDLLYHTFAEQLAKLPDTTRIYPGHDYIANNLRFTLDREPDNGKAEALLREVDPQDTDRALITTLAQEKEVNAFFRLTSPTRSEERRVGKSVLRVDIGGRRIIKKKNKTRI